MKGTTLPRNELKGSSKGFPIAGIVLIALGAGLLLCALLGCIAYRRTTPKDTDEKVNVDTDIDSKNNKHSDPLPPAGYGVATTTMPAPYDPKKPQPTASELGLKQTNPQGIIPQVPAFGTGGPDKKEVSMENVHVAAPGQGQAVFHNAAYDPHTGAPLQPPNAASNITSNNLSTTVPGGYSSSPEIQIVSMPDVPSPLHSNTSTPPAGYRPDVPDAPNMEPQFSGSAVPGRPSIPGTVSSTTSVMSVGAPGGVSPSQMQALGVSNSQMHARVPSVSYSQMQGNMGASSMSGALIHGPAGGRTSSSSDPRNSLNGGALQVDGDTFFTPEGKTSRPSSIMQAEVPIPTEITNSTLSAQASDALSNTFPTQTLPPAAPRQLPSELQDPRSATLNLPSPNFSQTSTDPNTNTPSAVIHNSTGSGGSAPQFMLPSLAAAGEAPGVKFSQLAPAPAVLPTQVPRSTVVVTPPVKPIDLTVPAAGAKRTPEVPAAGDGALGTTNVQASVPPPGARMLPLPASPGVDSPASKRAEPPFVISYRVEGQGGVEWEVDSPVQNSRQLLSQSSGVALPHGVRFADGPSISDTLPGTTPDYS